MKTNHSILLHAAVCATAAMLLPITASATLISSESFQTQATQSGGTYGTGAIGNVSNPANSVVVVGNSGFSASNAWANPTGSVSVASTTSLTGSVVSGSTQTGSSLLSPRGFDRNSVRQLAATPALSSSYYLSGLVNVGALSDLDTVGEYMACGFLGNTISATTVDINTGFHFGVRNNSGTIYLAAFAGGNAYDLLALNGSTITNTYQIVLQLDVNASGTDTLTAWYAQNNAGSLTQGLAPTSVETWSGAASLGFFAEQAHSTVSDAAAFIAFDEMRFGTSVTDVTAVPEPSTWALLTISGGMTFLMIMRRRRHASAVE